MHKKLRIAMFFSSDPSNAGGVQEHVFYLSKYLRKLGHQIDIFGPENSIRKYSGYREIMKTVKMPLPNGNWANITLEKGDDILGKINPSDYDVFHIHEPYIPFVGWEIIKNFNVPKVATFHTAWDEDSLMNFINPFIRIFQEDFSKNTKAAIFVSNIVRKRWQDMCSEKVIKEVIHNAVDSSFSHRKHKTGTAVKLLYVGRIVRRKGLDYLLKALKKTRNNDYSLTVIGDGPMKKPLEEYVKKNGLDGKVRFLGEIIGDARIKYYQEADVFCAPYSDEAFAMTILEAMATGLPIVGFKNEAFKEILRDYPAPELIVKPKVEKLLAQAIDEVISNGAKRELVREWSLKESRKYDWETVARKTEEIYYKISKS